MGNIFPLFFTGYNAIKSSKKLRKLEDNLEWFNTFVNLVNLCLDMFEWINLPETCNYRYLEQALLFEGKCGFAKDPDLGYLTLRCNQTNTLNIYGDYSEVDLYSFNGYQRRFKNYLIGGDNTDANAVVCIDNDCKYPYFNYILLGSERLSNAMRGIDVASMQLKQPYYITCEESQKLTVERILTDIDNNKPAIITTKSIAPDSFQVLQTGANPQVLLQMWDNYYKHDNLLRTLLGIQNNPNSDKSERLLVDEISSNNQLTDMNIQMRLKCRKLFCEQVNELFGLDLDVKLRHEIEVNNNDVYTNGETDNVSDMERNEKSMDE